jgi:hypothetical protein
VKSLIMGVREHKLDSNPSLHFNKEKTDMCGYIDINTFRVVDSTNGPQKGDRPDKYKEAKLVLKNDCQK